MNDIDKFIKNSINNMAYNIPINKNHIEKVKHSITQKEELKMKKSFKKSIVVAAAICVLGSITAVAGIKFSSTIGYSNANDNIEEFSKVKKLVKKSDMDLKYVEKFSNGYEFFGATPFYTHNEDNETGKKSDEWIEVSIDYQKDDEIVNFNATKNFEPVENFDSTENYNDIKIGYSKDNYLFVPVGYEPTDEEKALEDKGELYISYGSDAVIHNVVENVIWEENGIQYLLTAFDENLGAEGLTQMAKEIIEQE